MKIEKKIILVSILGLLLTSCGGGWGDAKRALTNTKLENSDEFFIEKKGPLTLPPDYETIPEPDSIKTQTTEKKENIEDILNISKEEKKITPKSKSTEQSILNQINK